MQRRKWEEDINEIKLEKALREERNREMILRKQKYEKKEMNRRFEEARQKYEAAQENLKIFLDKKEKKTEKLLSEICVSKELSRNKQKLEENEKRKLLHKALEEMHKRKEECTKLHTKVKNGKLVFANKSKEKQETMEKRKIIVSNR